jgi:hypothetical protein
LGPKDLAPEATIKALDLTAPGIAEGMRSSRGAKESMDSLFPGVFHALKMIKGGGHESTKKMERND